MKKFPGVSLKDCDGKSLTYVANLMPIVLVKESVTPNLATFRLCFILSYTTKSRMSPFVAYVKPYIVEFSGK